MSFLRNLTFVFSAILTCQALADEFDAVKSHIDPILPEMQQQLDKATALKVDMIKTTKVLACKEAAELAKEVNSVYPEAVTKVLYATDFLCDKGFKSYLTELPSGSTTQNKIPVTKILTVKFSLEDFVVRGDYYLDEKNHSREVRFEHKGNVKGAFVEMEKGTLSKMEWSSSTSKLRTSRAWRPSDGLSQILGFTNQDGTELQIISRVNAPLWKEATFFTGIDKGGQYVDASGDQVSVGGPSLGSTIYIDIKVGEETHPFAKGRSGLYALSTVENLDLPQDKTVDSLFLGKTRTTTCTVAQRNGEMLPEVDTFLRCFQVVALPRGL